MDGHETRAPMTRTPPSSRGESGTAAPTYRPAVSDRPAATWLVLHYWRLEVSRADMQFVVDWWVHAERLSSTHDGRTVGPRTSRRRLRSPTNRSWVSGEDG